MKPSTGAEACVGADAALVRAFDLLGKRWTGVVLGTLSGGPAGFRALARAVEGISDSMLSDRLSALCNAGLVTRTVHPTVPPKVEYELTPVARELHATLLSLTDWAERHRVTIAESRAAYDADHRPELLDT